MRSNKSHSNLRRFSRRENAQLSIQTIIFATIAVVIITGFVVLALSFLRISVRSLNKASAFSIAEAGIEYYRWHLAHDPDDYEDGTNSPGPYVHEYYDQDGQKIGEFILDITPPPQGSSIVTIKSTGRVLADASIQKVIEVKTGIPSLAQYAIVANENLRIGEGTTVYGQTHSNGGVSFDGVAHHVVSSAQPDYNDPDHGGGNEFGVHTHISPVDPLPPASVPSRPDVFRAGRQFPVPAVDFDGLTASLAEIKSGAQTGGHYFGASGVLGYHIVLRTNDTFDIYRVLKLERRPAGCTDIQDQDAWGTWSIEEETLLENRTLPGNGLIFVEDDLWIDGGIEGARLTIAAAEFPENAATMRSITINNDLRYANFDSQDVIGLIAQKNVNIGLISEDDLRIDAALVAKNGRVGRYYYRPQGAQGQGGCQPYHIRTKLTTYGMLATNKNLQFSYGDETGYVTKEFNYDPNLLYSPPPSFPVTSNQYVQLSWYEAQ